MTRRLRIISAIVASAVVLAAGVGISVATAPRAEANAAIHYVPIDPRVFISPQLAAKWANDHNEVAAYQHAAMLWAGLTSMTNQSYHGKQLAVYDTWFSPCDIYKQDTNCTSHIFRTPTEFFEVPRQFFHTPVIDSNNIFSSVRYNAEMKSFVDTGFGGAPYTTGLGLLGAMAAGQTNLVDTAVPSSMAIKPTYEVLSGTAPTVLPYWKGPVLDVPRGSTTSPFTPGDDTWLQAVLVDPTGHATNHKPISYCVNTYNADGEVIGHHTHTIAAGGYRVVPLSDFYAIPLTSADQATLARARADFRTHQIANMKRVIGVSPAATVQGCALAKIANPVVALIAMHVTSAEFHDTWTWQTFWWQPDVKPLPGSHGPFSHFDMKTAWWTVDRAPYGYRYTFNPYLEAPFGLTTFISNAWPLTGKPGSVANLGRTTNCISCHETATYTWATAPSPGPGYVAHGSQPQMGGINQIQTRNLWSLAIRAGHP
jgi:hypothetical protein